MSACGCGCVCHGSEASSDWPGPCAGCCEPGMDCACGRALAELFTPLTPPNPAAPPPKKCYRHKWRSPDIESASGVDQEWCTACGKVRDIGVTRRNRNNRSRGGREEAKVAALLGGRKVGPLGLPWDVEVPGYARVQTKQLDRWPSLPLILRWLDAIPVGPELRAVTIADTPGAGGQTRRLIVMDLNEYAEHHGRG